MPFEVAVPVKSGTAFEVGVPSALFEIRGGSEYDVTADGQRFLVTMPVEDAPTSSPITVVVNWQAGLKK